MQLNKIAWDTLYIFQNEYFQKTVFAVYKVRFSFIKCSIKYYISMTAYVQLLINHILSQV